MDLLRARDMSRAYRVDSGAGFKLRDFDPADTGPLQSNDEPHARALTGRATARLAELQDMLYAQDRWALLVLIQGMDAAGKDTAIREVMSGINPQGCQVFAFKKPSEEELDHDFLWRCTRCFPERGRIGVFNRSYYEEVLVARVHPEVLERQKLPPELVTKRIWRERFEDIRALERYATRQGIVVRKFLLHVSKTEQKRRLLGRIAVPGKNWKFRAGDIGLRQHWRAYQRAFEDTIRATATPAAPWYVVPADNKWYSRLVIASALVEALESLRLSYPKLSRVELRELAKAKRALERE
ncbi:MAG TPA: PPK2 family polyphosphate kinase [Myxococcota bacterium]|nr:PPK2 family polyphosphate kinase [Myxococcota bacterium]